jgi:glycosyltransferase involved in cell wall biosynthesis
MNRNENLVKAIPSWLECDEIQEIIIVDWSSTEHVSEYLLSRGFDDNRIKVIRVEDQSRWILSYAFNIGFRMASYDTILKTDADIIVYPEFFQRNRLSSSIFISGDWRIAPKGQEHINGFFYIYRENLMRIKGFNEYITTYGWDDDDIYHRLEASGTKRTHVDIETIYHIPHDDALRIDKTDEARDFLSEFEQTTKFKIRANRYLANVMPVWNKDRVFLPFKIESTTNNLITIRQSGESIHYVPKHIRDDAEYYAALEIASWRLGLRIFDLDRNNLRKLLTAKEFETLNKLDVEIAIYNQAPTFKFSQNNLLVILSPSFVDSNESNLTKFLQKLEAILKNNGKALGLASDSRAVVAKVIPETNTTYFVPSWRNLGELKYLNSDNFLTQIQVDESFQLILDENNLKKIDSIISSKKNLTNVSNQKRKIYIDAQHGLGNRLRAIASAAVIAKSTNRELVIVWEPDHHCECRFSDLYDYQGAVIETSFVRRASESMSVYNYMEIEPGAKKDQAIIIDENKDIYARSAYVLNSELSEWQKENEFLQSLTPTQQVLNLVEPFDVSNAIGAHVRMEAGKGLDHNTYDSVANWTAEGHDELQFWREKSHYSHFIKRIDILMKENPNARLFLATDLPETYKAFEDYYGDKLSFLKREVYDRSKEQIIYALADVILLSKCERLLGSTWSSFSELAMRLSKTYSKIEMSGKDF